MKQELTYLATAVMFLTRLPVGKSGSGEPEDLAASTQYFPLVGVVIGVLVSLVFVAANLVWNPAIATVLSLIAGVLLTGGFHEDGLADVADSAGAWTIERRLEIMRDSRVGTYGSLALILMMLLKFSALSAIAESLYTDSVAGDVKGGNDSDTSGWSIASVFLLAHVLARWSILPMVRLTPYARTDSNNSVFAAGVNNYRLLVGSVITAAVMLACSLTLGMAVVAAFALSCVAMVVARRWYLVRVGGITGDCLGATNQVVEVLVYLCIAALLS